MGERPLQTPQWWLSHLRRVVSSYGPKSAMFALMANLARDDGYEPPKKLSGGARRHRPRPARDALFLANRRSNKDLAEWWQKIVEAFIVRAESESEFLSIRRPPKRADLNAAYREWMGVVSDSISVVIIGNYKVPKLTRDRRGKPPKWTGRYLLCVPKGNQAARDDVALRFLMVDLAVHLPDATMTAREVRRIRRRRTAPE